MIPGRARTSITIQRPTVTTDDLGQPITTWSDVVTVPAAVEPISATETNTDVVIAKTRYKYRIKYTSATIEPNYRIKLPNDDVHYITAVYDLDGRRHTLVLEASWEQR